MPVSDIRYKRLGYIALNVTNLARSAAFYEQTVGLTPAGGGFFRCSEKHHDILLVESPTPGLKRIGWQMESESALAAVRARFQHATPVSESECQSLGISAAFRATEPSTGTCFEFYVDMSPAPTPFHPTHTKIARLGHAVLSSPARDATAAFMRDTLNFRISDKIEDTVVFMRCFPNPFHHSFGVGNGPVPLLHHVNFMVTEMDDIGKAYWRVQKAGSRIVFGPGRHPPSDSIFLYFLDPDGITLEYSFGMEEFPEAEPRSARDMPKGLDSIDYWGATPQPGFGATGAIE